MDFIRRNLLLLLFAAVLTLACIMTLRQFQLNQVAHIDLREDFLLLHDRREDSACAHLYQHLILDLPKVSDLTLLDDLHRTGDLIDANKQDLDSLVWKYHVSVKNELQKRSEQRVARALQRARQP